MTRRRSQRLPGIWQGVRWALAIRAMPAAAPRVRACYGVPCARRCAKALNRWMSVVFELRSREILHDPEGEYLRAIRPYVHRGTGISERVVRLVDHMDWLETAFHPAAFAQVASGQPLVLAELTPPSATTSYACNCGRRP